MTGLYFYIMFKYADDTNPFRTNPSNPQSEFYTQFQNNKVFMFFIKSSKEPDLQNIKQTLSKENISDIIDQINEHKSNDYKFSKIIRSHITLSFHQVEQLFAFWSLYSREDKEILITFYLWNKIVSQIE